MPQFTIAASVLVQLIGLPIAWLKVRKTEEWKQRPRDKWTIALLDGFIGMYVVAAGIYGAVVGLATWLGTTLA